MNRRQRKAAEKQLTAASPGFTKQQLKNASRIAKQVYIWRYAEDNSPDLEEGYGFRGVVKRMHQHQYHNLALALPMRWQAVAIIYLKDNWGKYYREFSFAITNQAFKGIGQGISPLINLIAERAEKQLNTKHIYARAVMFSPYSEEFSSLIPLLKREMDNLKLVESDIEALAQEEAYTKTSLCLQEKYDVDDEIAKLLA